jgi:hypothetical protein
MTARDKLIDLLTHDIPSGDHRGTLAFSARVAVVIADHLIASGVTFADATDNNVGHKWIPVTERLPSNGELVLALSSEYTEYQVGMLAECEEEQCGIVCVGDGVELYRITHWMPMPEPPKGVE